MSEVKCTMQTICDDDDDKVRETNVVCLRIKRRGHKGGMNLAVQSSGYVVRREPAYCVGLLFLAEAEIHTEL